MKQKNKIWTTISLNLYAKIVKLKKEESFSTVTKTILFILKNHKETSEDFFYNSKESKTLMMTVNEKMYENIETQTALNSMSTSKYVRCVLNSYFENR